MTTPGKRLGSFALGGQKALKRSDDDFKLVLLDVHPFRRVLESYATITQHTCFKVVRGGEKDRWLLEARGEDHSHTCIVSARLLIDKVERADGDAAKIEGASFVLDTNDALATIRGTMVSQQLHIDALPSICKVLLGLYNPDSKAHGSLSVLDCYVDPVTQPPPNILYDEFLLDIEVQCLKEFLSRGGWAKAEYMRITLYTQEIASKTYSLLEFSTMKGTFEHRMWFSRETSKHEDGSIVVRAAEDADFESFSVGEDLKPVYDHCFQIKRIEAFVKGIAARFVVARLKKDEALLLEQHLAGSTDDEQHLRFLIALSRHDDDE